MPAAVKTIRMISEAWRGSAGHRFRAPSPILVTEGDAVVEGDALAVLEAMKMEHTTCAPSDGVCEAFKVALGEQVAEGAELVQFSDSAPTVG